MNDLPVRLAERIARVVTACESACERHRDLLDVQRAALRTDDGELLVGLADESAELLAVVERETRFPAEIRTLIDRAQGPRATTARQRMERLRHLVLRAQAGVREVETALFTRRAALLRELGALTLAGPGAPLIPPASLDVTG